MRGHRSSDRWNLRAKTWALSAVAIRLGEIKKLTESQRVDLARELGDSTEEMAEFLLVHLADDRSSNVREDAIHSSCKRGGAAARMVARACLINSTTP